MNFFWIVVLAAAVLMGQTGGVMAEGNYEEIEKGRSLAPIGYYNSQYSPWVMHQQGWQTYLIYYCKNVAINGKWTDRVWRAEGDGKSNWASDQMVLEGTWNQDDALSCSPGVAIDGSGVWHMYYIAANNLPEKPGLYIYHATATAPGISWEKKGKIVVEGRAQPIFGNEFIETPSPRWENGEMVMTFTGFGQVYEIRSRDGHNFGPMQTLNTPKAGNARIKKSIRGGYYMVYDYNPLNKYEPSTVIAVSYSNDGKNFLAGKVLVSSGAEWDGYYRWTPDLFEENKDIIRVYYAGVSEDGRKAGDGLEHWWGVNTAIGYRRFNVMVPTNTVAPKVAGDANGDNKVDLSDFVVWKREYLGQVSTKTADFNGSGSVGLEDFVTWKKGYLGL